MPEGERLPMGAIHLFLYCITFMRHPLSVLIIRKAPDVGDSLFALRRLADRMGAGVAGPPSEQYATHS
jgi:hypothetical protein